MYIWGLIAAAVIVLDQASKFFIENTFSLTDSVAFIPGIIDFVFVKNTGAAFSVLAKHTWILAILSVVFSIAILIYLIKEQPKDRLIGVCCGLILGGAIGNGIDRMLRGYVVDFIELTFFRFPVFNIADIAITVGGVIAVLIVMKRDKEQGDLK